MIVSPASPSPQAPWTRRRHCSVSRQAGIVQGSCSRTSPGARSRIGAVVGPPQAHSTPRTCSPHRRDPPGQNVRNHPAATGPIRIPSRPSPSTSPCAPLQKQCSALPSRQRSSSLAFDGLLAQAAGCGLLHVQDVAIVPAEREPVTLRRDPEVVSICGIVQARLYGEDFDSHVHPPGSGTTTAEYFLCHARETMEALAA